MLVYSRSHPGGITVLSEAAQMKAITKNWMSFDKNENFLEGLECSMRVIIFVERTYMILFVK